MRARLERIWALVVKESIQVVRDRTTLAIVILAPVIELFLFAYAVDLTVYHIPMAVADGARDEKSRAFIAALVTSGYFDVNCYVADEDAAIARIDDGTVRAGLVIPSAFASAVERREGQVLILLDGSDSFTVQSGYGAALAVGQAHALRVLVEQVEQLGDGTDVVSLPIDASIRVLYNPGLDDMVFVVPVLVAILLQLLTVNLVSVSVVRERELGTAEQLLATPARPLERVIAKIVPNAVLSILVMLIVIAAGTAWFGVPFQGNPWLFAWLSLLFLLASLGMGLLVSTISQNQKQAQQLTSLLMVLSLLLTGFIYPLEPMPPGVRAVSSLIPLTYFNRIVRGIFTKGVGLAMLWTDVVALLVYGALVSLLSVATFKKRLD
jgi:ABC-2 type transport system permease protein